MRRYSFFTCDVFTSKAFGGNPLAVFPEAKGLSQNEMQTIAKEMNLSETTFVFEPESSTDDFKLKIFTPKTELQFAGHPTLGTAFILKRLNLIRADTIRFQEGVGSIFVKLMMRAEEVRGATLTTAKPPERGANAATISKEIAAEILGLSMNDLEEKLPIDAFSCGTPFTFVGLKNLEAVKKIDQLNLASWGRSLKSSWAPSLFVFCRETEDAKAHLHARMFAPAKGIQEDPATGAAVAALSGYLNAYLPGQTDWKIEQGFEMGRPSLLDLSFETDSKKVTKVHVGGECVAISEGFLNLP